MVVGFPRFAPERFEKLLRASPEALRTEPKASSAVRADVPMARIFVMNPI
jgi:hypothetical protein